MLLGGRHDRVDRRYRASIVRAVLGQPDTAIRSDDPKSPAPPLTSRTLDDDIAVTAAQFDPFENVAAGGAT